MASGAGGQIGLIKQSSLYRTTNSVTIWSNFVSESLEHTLEELEEGSITGRRDAPPSHKGIDHGAGDIVMEPNPRALGHYLNGVFGTAASSVVTAPTSGGANSGDNAGLGQYFHRFTPRASAFDERSFLEPYGVMVYKDVGSAFMFNGCVFHGIELNIQAGQLVQATVNVMGRDVRRIERIASISSLVSGGGRPFVWDMASVEVASGGTGLASLVANTNFEQLTIGMTVPQEGVVLLDGTKKYAEFQLNDFRRVNISGTLSFRSQEEYEAFIAYESRYLRLTMLNVNSQIMLGNPASLDATAFLGYFGMRIEIPKMKYLSWSTPIGGPNRLQTSFTAKAEYSESDGFMIRCDLNNSVATH